MEKDALNLRLFASMDIHSIYYGLDDLPRSLEEITSSIVLLKLGPIVVAVEISNEPPNKAAQGDSRHPRSRFESPPVGANSFGYFRWESWPSSLAVSNPGCQGVFN